MSVWLSRRLVLLLLGRVKVGSLIVVEGDERLVLGCGSPTATVQIASSRTWRMLLRGSRGMAEAFAQGLWDSPDLVALIRLAARNAGGLDRLRSRLGPVRWPLQRAEALLRPSTKRRRRRDIAAHYDLGNELFARMLDPTMSYSCALFEYEARRSSWRRSQSSSASASSSISGPAIASSKLEPAGARSRFTPPQRAAAT
jgi:cyclopropane-fatty-acyl-phospholipid synthase